MLFRSLVEGWVDEVVSQATETKMPNAAKLQEAVRRRRATGGPAEQTFATLVGLELRPRRLREAAELWRLLAEKADLDTRDGLWAHPDLLPVSADLDDPAAFVEKMLAGDADDPMAELEKTLSAEKKMDEASGAASDGDDDGSDDTPKA